jgi:hypothetical protein
MLEFALLSGLWLINNGVASERWVHPLAKPLEIDRNGPFVVLDDGSLGTVDEHGFRISKDDGKTWSEAVPVCKGINPKEPASFYLLRTRNNTLVLVYLNFAEYRFEWDEERKEPKEVASWKFGQYGVWTEAKLGLTTNDCLAVTMPTFSG